ncbi:protein angel homolog 2-like [Saccoglossus kowalevskii]|uniref:Protein angel homolog 2-like n=1 Tax=Saccoglossus kowalevskii TaxID=10224 RepID=A0ABM0GY42_SACKO|nr:PREDICTED: protein angel homolog 2-like [Saccoglossus kowalevskii]
MAAWPWNSPQFRLMWNQNCQQIRSNSIVTNQPFSAPPLLALHSTIPTTPGVPIYRRSSPTTSLGTLAMRPPIRTASVQPVYRFVSNTLTNTFVRSPYQIYSAASTQVSSESNMRKRTRQDSASDKRNIPAATRPRVSISSSVCTQSSQNAIQTECQQQQPAHDSSAMQPEMHNIKPATLFSSRQSVRDTSTGTDIFSRELSLKSVPSHHGRRHGNVSVKSAQNSSGAESDDSAVNNPEFYRRDWIYTDIGKEHIRKRKPGIEFSIMSYNVLAQRLIEMNMFLYPHCNEDILKWEYRKNNLMKEIKELQADILCLQEVQEEHFQTFYQPQLALLGYEGVFKRRTGDKHDGCATFFLTSQFELETYRLIQYYKPGVYLLNRDNVGVIVLLKPKVNTSSHQRICVANTHLLFNPKRGDVKLAQLAVLFAEIDKLALRRTTHNGRPVYCPTLLCGDMNSIPYSPLYRFISGMLKYTGTQTSTVSGQHRGWHGDVLPYPLWPRCMGITDACKYVEVVEERRQKKKKDGDGWQEVKPRYTFSETIKHDFNFRSVYTHRTENRENEVTTNHDKTNCTLDYIFYSLTARRREEQKHGRTRTFYERYEGPLKLLGKLALFSDSKANKMGGLPNRMISSDHFSLQAKFLLQED